jgi:hypothetical protein
MRHNVWDKSILVMTSLFLVLFFVNIVVAADANSYNDMAITAQVQSKLQSDSQLTCSRISVETKNGEVTLKGVVDSEADITRAGKLASWVDGVKNVDNRLKREQAFSSSTGNYGGMGHALGCPVGANWAC